MKRLPVYLLIDTSGSMKGEPIESVRQGISEMLSVLRNEMFSLNTVWISIITYDREAKVLLPLTSVKDIVVPVITTPDSGPTHTGAALEVLCSIVAEDRKMRGGEVFDDWMPLLFVLTDGKPSDTFVYEQAIPDVKRLGFGNIVACAAGPKSQTTHLQLLTENVCKLSTMNSEMFKSFFKWVTAVISEDSQIKAGPVPPPYRPVLPPPPPEIELCAI